MRAIFSLLLLTTACTTAVPGLDADPTSLQIEIGRYSALLGQVAEYTGVSYEHVGAGTDADGPDALMQRLREATADYNAVRRALCASRAGATDYVQVRTQSCGKAFQPHWARGPVTHEEIARRSRAAGGVIIPLWTSVCDEARRLEKDPDTMVCPME
jgi:hypothetical protein